MIGVLGLVTALLAGGIWLMNRDKREREEEAFMSGKPLFRFVRAVSFLGFVTRHMAEQKINGPHRRFNPLKEEWVIVAPQRCNRPWEGQSESVPEEKRPSFDPSNPLCPGVTRKSGVTTPQYTSTYVFENDFPALEPAAEEVDEAEKTAGDLFKSASGRGNCRVMCFHPHSNLQLTTMQKEEVIAVIDTWISEMRTLGQQYEWVQIFENKGAVMGCSNAHPHCQIWSSRFLPNEPAVKDRTQKAYKQKIGEPMLVKYVREELDKKERIVVEGKHWVALVPFWAVWPYETMLLPKRHILRLTDLTEDEKGDLAATMQELLIRYDNLFHCSFPYSMGWHGAPTGSWLTEGNDASHWQLHAVYLPPLLRSATVKKFMAGYEMVCMPQRDLTPEMAAAKLRSLPSVHYSLQKM